MPPKLKPIELVRQGLTKLKAATQGRVDEIKAALDRQEAVSDTDLEFINQAGNHVTEDLLLERLSRAPDFDTAVAELDAEQQEVIAQLMQHATIGKEKPTNKRKRPAVAAKPVKKAKAPRLTHSENATLSERIAILDWHHDNGGNQSATARHFAPLYPKLNIKQPLISSWVSQEADFRERWAGADTNADKNAKRVRQTQHPEITEMITLWVAKAMDDGIQVSGEVLRQKWIHFADLAGVPAEDHLHLSNGWMNRFKAHLEIKEMRRHGEGGSAKPEDIEAERQRMRKLLDSLGYAPRDTYNMDETGLFWAMPPDHGLANKKMSRLKGSKVRLTYAFTANADGSDKLPPFIIGKAQRPRCFGRQYGKQLGFNYTSNAKAWMTSSLYESWIKDWDRELVMKGRKVLLLQDNFSGHIVPPGLAAIRVENFAPNLTAHVQPMDQGIIRAFKAHYRRLFISRAIENYDDGTTTSDIYTLNQLEAMRIAANAWKEVDVTTICNCWKKAGILPTLGPMPALRPSLPISALLHPDAINAEPAADTDADANADANPAANAEQRVEAALDALEKTGVLRAVNRMSVAELLNPPNETSLSTTAAGQAELDKEIAEAVLVAEKARENMEITGGDDVDPAPISPPPPTASAALEAISILRQYVQFEGDAPARQLEDNLGMLARKLRLKVTSELVPSSITSYFSRQVQ